MAVYPTGIVGTGTLITIVATEPTNNPSHTGQHNNINGEVIAIETALGTSPQGSYATVSAALSTHGTLITAAQTTATTALTTATTALTTATAAQTTANTAVAAATAAQTTANTAVAAAATAQTTANSRATYPAAGVPLSTGSAWSTSYTVGTATGSVVAVGTNGFVATSIIGGLFGAWTSKNVNQIYQATTDGFIIAYGTNSAAATSLNIVTDSNAAPSTLRAYQNSPAGGYYCFVISPVRKNDYYEVGAGTLTTSGTYFISMGS